MHSYKRQQIRKSTHKNKILSYDNTTQLTVCVVFPPGAIYFACFIDAEEELVGRVKSP